MPVPRRCPSCGGYFNYRTNLFEHWNDCADPFQLEYPEAEQERDERELRGDPRRPVPMDVLSAREARRYDELEHPPDHDCEECENARRSALTEAYPWLARFGLSPKTEVDL